jgi:Zn-dependent protease with chaperone function
MREKARLLAVVLAFGVAKGIQLKTQHSWEEAVSKELGEEAQSRQEEFSLARACADPEMSGKIGELCGEYHSLTTMGTAAVWTGGGAVLLLVLIASLGYASRFSRRALLAFKPGLLLAIGGLVALIPLNAALIIFAIYFGESSLIGRVHIGVLFGIGLGALVGTLAMIKGTLGIVKRAHTTVVGKRLDESANPDLLRFVNELAMRLQAAPPQHIIIGLNPNFFVTEADVRCLDGEFNGRTLFLSLPLCRILSLQELEAVIGHELGHYVGLDTQFSRKFYPIYRGASESLAGVAANIGEGSSGVALLPALYILSFLLESFAVAENRNSRERELAADQVAARAVDARTFATALVKIHAFIPCWEGVSGKMRKTLETGKQFVNVSSLFAAVARDVAQPEFLEGLAEHKLPHPTDSHPPLGVRLRSLQVSLADLSDDALQVSPDAPAVNLLSDFESSEEQLTDIENALLVQSGQVKLPESNSEVQAAGSSV